MSDEFFNQSFSPAPSSGNRAPPPPAPRSGGIPSNSMSSLSQRKSASSNRAPPPPAPRSGGVPGRTSNGSGNGNVGFYSTQKNNISIAAPRPTGDYYATTSTNNGPSTTTSAPTASFYNMSGSATGAAQAPPAPSPYGYSDNSPYGNVSSTNTPFASSNEPAVSQPEPMTQEQTMEGTGGEWFSSSASSTTAPSFQTSNFNNPYGTSTNRPNDTTANADVNGSMSGPMSSSANTTKAFSGTILNPNNSFSNSMKSSTSSSSIPTAPYDPHEFDNEPPLLEELGINFTHIRTKSLAVLLPMKFAASLEQIDTSMMEDNDMAGPMAFALALGGELLLCGKIHFGYIYGFCLFGCLATTLILNLMAPTTSISIWTVVSILGYSLLPVNFLAGLNIVYRIQLMGSVGMVLAALTIVWCTLSSTRLFERGCGLRDQRYLVGYPNMLLYSAFVMITIF